MSWFTNTINDITQNPDSALNKYLNTGTVGEFSMDNKTILRLGLGLFITGVCMMLFFKFFIQKK